MIGIDNTEQPMDPRLVMAIEAAFRYVSLTNVQFVPMPQIWRESNPNGGVGGPGGTRKAQIKMDLAKRDGFRCAYCTREFIDLDDATLDHVIPNCIVRHWEPWNLVLACEPCNNAKGDQVPLALMPLLCNLLRELAPLAPLVREQQEAEAERLAERRAKNKRDNKARYKARRRERTTNRRLAMQRTIEDLTGRPVRIAIEAPAPRAALLPKPGEQR